MELSNSSLRLYSVSAAAKELRIRKETLSNLIEDGKIGIVQLGKRVKISHLELVEFIKRSTIKLSSKVNPTQTNIDSILKKHKTKNRNTASERIDKIFKNFKR